MATISGRWRESHQAPKLPLSWADAKGGLNGAIAVDADNRVVARIDPKGDVYVLTVDGWLWRVVGDKGTARFNAILASDPDPREKLITEKLCQYYSSDYGIPTRIVRFHNIFGPNGTWDGGREKAPAALCRKVATVEDGGEIEIWGDGEQTRSFCYIDDCVEGIYRLMQSDYGEPLNLGTDRMVSINELARIIIGISGKHDISIRHIEGPQGVRGRNSDNTRLREVLGWEPAISLEDGLATTYRWIDEQVHGREGAEWAAEATVGAR